MSRDDIGDAAPDADRTQEGHYVLRLYVTGMTHRSVQAIDLSQPARRVDHEERDEPDHTPRHFGDQEAVRMAGEGLPDLVALALLPALVQCQVDVVPQAPTELDEDRHPGRDGDRSRLGVSREVARRP